MKMGWLVERIYGRDGEHWTLYLWRLKLTPNTPWGGLYFHVFLRGDQDPDLHDHPWNFVTFPLTSYWEEYWVGGEGLKRYAARRVKAFRFHWRSAEYAHRVLGRDWVYGPEAIRVGVQHQGWIFTFIWHSSKKRSWGFWVDEKWVPWREYILNDE